MTHLYKFQFFEEIRTDLIIFPREGTPNYKHCWLLKCLLIFTFKDSESDSGGRSRKPRKRQTRSSSSDDSDSDVAQRLKDLIAQGVISAEDSRRLLTMSELERETEIVRIREQLEQQAHQYFSLSNSRFLFECFIYYVVPFSLYKRPFVCQNGDSRSSRERGPREGTGQTSRTHSRSAGARRVGRVAVQQSHSGLSLRLHKYFSSRQAVRSPARPRLA